MTSMIGKLLVLGTADMAAFAFYPDVPCDQTKRTADETQYGWSALFLPKLLLLLDCYHWRNVAGAVIFNAIRIQAGRGQPRGANAIELMHDANGHIYQKIT